MTVNEMRVILDRIPGEAELRAYDPETKRLEPITGIAYGQDRDGTGYVEVQTDDIN